jgi:hypothetical protein
MLRLDIIRRGRLMHVAVRLDPRPAGIDDPTIRDAWVADRQQKADAYWMSQFAPVLAQESERDE